MGGSFLLGLVCACGLSSRWCPDGRVDAMIRDDSIAKITFAGFLDRAAELSF